MDTSIEKNQVAIVTGASSGIGLGITQALLQRGYRVVANSRKITQSKDLRPSADLVLVDGDIGKKDVAAQAAGSRRQHTCRHPPPHLQAGTSFSATITQRTSPRHSMK